MRCDLSYEMDSMQLDDERVKMVALLMLAEQEDCRWKVEGGWGVSMRMREGEMGSRLSESAQ
jgi:hypothetical protein